MYFKIVRPAIMFKNGQMREKKKNNDSYLLVIFQNF